MKSVQHFLTALVFVFCNSPATADPRCDCAYDRIEGLCTAALERKKDWIVINSDTRRCSSVTWQINGFPQLSVVTDGTLTEPLISVPDNAKIEVRSCKICRDANFLQPPSSPASRPQATTVTSPPSSPFQGKWSGSLRWGFLSSRITLDLAVESGRITGTSTASDFTVVIQDGHVNGNVLTYSYVGQGGVPGSGTIRLKDERHASVSEVTSGMTWSGEVTRDDVGTRTP